MNQGTVFNKRKKINKFAVISFILGILVFFVSIIEIQIIMISVLLGYIAKKEIKRSNFMQKGNIFATLGIFLSLFYLFSFKIFSQIENKRYREHLYRAVCMTNLKQIGEGLYFYSLDNAGYFPEKLSALYPHYINKAEIFWCPSDKDPKPEKIENDIPDNKNSACISYQYNPGYTENDYFLIPLIWDNGCGISGNHKDGGNVLYLDGSVKWIPCSKWKSVKHGKSYP